MTIIMHQQDCLEGMKTLQAKSVKVVITSPPYNIGAKYGAYTDNRGDYLLWLAEVWTEVERILADDGHFFLQAGGTNIHPFLPFEIMYSATGVGFKLQNMITWVKSISIDGVTTGHFKPINSKRFLNPTNEFIYHLTKDCKVPINRLAIGVPYMDKSNEKRWESAQAVRCQGNTWFMPYDTIQSRHKDRASHPATFPLELPLRCLKLSGIMQGEIVLDPFAGIGTTLKAASIIGCDAIGYEIDPIYVGAYNEQV